MIRLGFAPPPLLLLLLLACIVPAGMPACSPSAYGPKSRVSYNNGVKVAGVVTYRERVALPDDAVVTVRLLDTTREAAPALMLAEQVIVKPGQVPVPFVMVIDPRKVEQNHNYAVEATINVNRRAVWASTAHQATITRGHPAVGLTVWVEKTE